jgi:tetratricopeptide (TPR) repeat protein
LGRVYYLLALSAAERGDLSACARLASLSVALGYARDGAVRRLLGLCLYELGELERAADALADCPELADEVRVSQALTKAGLADAEAFLRRGSWRAALRAVSAIPHQSVRLLNIRGCILAGSKRYARAGRLFAQALRKDAGGRAAPEYLREAAGRAPFFGRG